MKERIIFSGGINNSEILKSLALNNIKSFNVRVWGANELAEYALLKEGYWANEKKLTSKEGIGIICGIMKEISYFNDSNYQDALNLYSSINSIRKLARNNEENVVAIGLKKGIFIDKNEAILKVYQKYCKYKKDNSLIDTIDIIRSAISKCKKLEAYIDIVDEFKLSPLEEELYFTLSANDKLEYSSVAQLFNKQYDGVNIRSYTNCYGIPNEVSTILASIYSDNKAIDKYTVVVCNENAYSQAFFDAAVINNIPVTFGTGVPIINSYPGKLLSSYYRWKVEGYYGLPYLEKLLLSPYFDKKKLKKKILDSVGNDDEDFSVRRLITRAGNLRLSADRKKNDELIAEIKNESEIIYNAIKVISDALSLPLADFIKTYSRIRYAKSNSKKTNAVDQFINSLDVSAVNYIYSQMDAVSGVDNISEMEVVLKILDKNICKEVSKEGFLHITSVTGAFSAVRDNLYIAGLSAKNYPGSPKENYLILDEDFTKFKDGERYTSIARLLDKNRIINRLVKLYTALEKDIYISFSGHNVSELKEENSSSVIFDLYREQYGAAASFASLEERIISAGYFDSKISNTSLVGKAYNSNKIIKESAKKIKSAEDKKVKAFSEETAYSPSAMMLYWDCKRKYMFKYVLNIPDVSRFDNLAVISPKDEGILAHTVMEKAVTINDITENQLREIAEETFDNYLKSNTVIVESDGINAKNSFVDMMLSAIDMVPKGEVLLSEDEIVAVYDDVKIKLRGKPDCVIKTENGKCIIIDYKTGYEVKQVKDDLLTCLQGVVYAFLIESQGEKVDHIEYRYLRNNEIITCDYNDAIKDRFGKALFSFRQYLEENRFGSNEEESKCKNCSYKDICKSFGAGEE